MAKSVVAIFNASTDIDSVTCDLERIGVPRRRVHALGRAEVSEREARSWKDRVAAFFGWSGQTREREIGAAYADVMEAGDTLLIVEVEDPMAERTAGVLNQYGAVEAGERQRGRVERASPAAPESQSFPVREPTTAPVMQEELLVGKGPVARGGVHSQVEEIPVEEVVRLREEHVDVERCPVDRSLDTGEVFEEVILEVTETAEQAVVAKQARVVEEVGVDKTAEEHEETIEDTVRRRDVEVEPLRSTGTGG